MDYHPCSSPRLKTRGQVEIISSDGRSWTSPNYIVDQASQYVGLILEGTFSGSLYRMAIGQGGYSGAPPVRTLPNDSWYAYTGLVTPIVSKPVATRTVVSDGHVTSITLSCTFSGADHASPTSDFNEACLILGSGTAGTQTGGAYLGAADRMYAYRTFDNFSVPAAGTSTLTINWTIFVENA